MWRSVGAVFAGYVTWTVIWLVANAAIAAGWSTAFDERGGTSNTGVLLAVLMVAVAASLVSGWLTTKIASRGPLQHASVLGLALLATGIGVQASAWNLLPQWFHIAFLASLVPATLLGAVWRRGHKRASTTVGDV